MNTTRWNDLNHKSSPATIARTRAAARAEINRLGLADLRKAQQRTQVELGKVLDLPQASISEIENRTDLLLSTLGKYVRGLGGELEVRAVFPKATFQLEPGIMGKRRKSLTKKKLAIEALGG
jgi:DNA-binding XRE family transcriptional regulator